MATATRFHSLEELIEDLRQRQVGIVSLIGKVATTTSPGGKRITFRGQVVVAADLGGGERAEYVERVAPYVTEPSPPDLPVEEGASDELQRCRQALMSQLRAYRGEYQGLMAAARASLAERLRQAGIAVAEAE